MLRVVAPLLAVHKIIALRAWLAAPLVVERVTSAFALRVVVPAIAESIKSVIELLTVVPHVPDKSPVVGKAKPKRGEKLVTAMLCPYSPFRMLIACTYDFVAAVDVCQVGSTPAPFDTSTCPDVPGSFVALTEYSAGYVTNTSLVPAEKSIFEGCVPELFDKTVVRARRVPADVYVPIPTSHWLPVCPAMV